MNGAAAMSLLSLVVKSEFEFVFAGIQVQFCFVVAFEFELSFRGRRWRCDGRPVQTGSRFGEELFEGRLR